MTRIDVVGPDAIRDIQALAESFGVLDVDSTTISGDLYGGIQSIDELPCPSSMERVPIRFAVDGVIPFGAITMLVGPPGCGKTTFATAMAGAISEGRPFAGLRTTQAAVLHLDRENGLSVVQERLSRLGVRSGALYKIYGNWAGNGPPYPDADIVVDHVKKYAPNVVLIVDSFVAFHPGNENDAQETRVYFNVLRRLVSLGAAVVIIHHSGKADSAQRYRGSSDIEAACDVAYLVKNNGGTRLDKVQLEAFKARFTVTGEMTFQYNDGVFSISDKRILSSADLRLEQLLKDNPGISGTQFEANATAMKLTRSSARAFLMHNKRVVRNGTKNKGYTYSWCDDPNLIGGI